MATEKDLPEITYPALYVFRAICRSRPDAPERVRNLVQSVIGPVADDAVTTRPSRGDAYIAVHVTCLLTSEEQRQGVYAALKGDSDILLSL